MDCEPEFEESAQTWLETAIMALAGLAVTTGQPVLAMAGDVVESEAEAPAATPAYTRQKPLHARLIINRRLNAEDAEKEIRQFGFDLGNSDFTYEAGDTLGVWPTNCPERVAI